MALQPPFVAVDRVRARPLSARDRQTRYAFGNNPPPGDRDNWPTGWGTGCSGFVAWCFGLGRWPRQHLPSRLSTDAIFLDANRATGSQLFSVTAEPKPRDIVIYPSYATLPLTYAQCELEAKYDAFARRGMSRSSRRSMRMADTRRSNAHRRRLMTRRSETRSRTRGVTRSSSATPRTLPMSANAIPAPAHGRHSGRSSRATSG